MNYITISAKWSNSWIDVRELDSSYENLGMIEYYRHYLSLGSNETYTGMPIP